MEHPKHTSRRRWRVASLLLLVVALAGLPAVTVRAAVDLTVVGLEITQAIQTTTNTITLVAQRSTAVRATIGVAGGGPVAGVTGVLHVFVNGTEITPSAGIAPINAPFTAPVAPQRGNENDTLNFELPAPTGITASADVDMRVDITPVPGETNTANNSGAVNNLTFANRTTPALYFTRINWTPSGLGFPALADVQPGRGDAFVRGIFPVNDGDPNLYRPGLFPTLTYSQDANANGVLEEVTEGDNLLGFLASCRQLIVNNGLGATNNTFLFGWINGNPIDGNGLGQISGFNAYGNTQAVRYQRSYAHELTHNFGLNHNNRTLNEVGWDVGARLPNNPAGNNTSGRLKGTTLNDIMVGGQLTNSAWVDTITYNFFLGSPILMNSPIMNAADAADDQPRPRVLVIQGIFDPSGKELVSLQPAFRFPWPSQPTSSRQQGQYTAQVVDEAGTITGVQFNALVGDDSGEESGNRRGFFEVMIPVAPDREVASVRILDSATGREFGGFQRSAPPQVAIVEPTPGARLGTETRITWNATDPDTPPQQLSYQVSYSPDSGLNWVPIAVNVPGTQRSIVFNSTEIQQSAGKGILRVFVSDGLNTSFADVTALTPVAAQYPPPQVRVYLPVIQRSVQ